jgi:uncharacterized DUF497 family protein
LKIKEIIFLPAILNKLIWKHDITEHEVRQVIRDAPKFYFIEKGDVRGEDLYSAIGRTEAGRYLTVFFIYKKTKDALIISARDTDDNERKRYVKK